VKRRKEVGEARERKRNGEEIGGKGVGGGAKRETKSDYQRVVI
jgi:hypothetical protein